MKMNKYFFTSLFVVITIFNISAQEETTVFGADSIVQEYYLGFNLIPNAFGGLVNFAMVKPLPNGKKELIFISKDEFISQALGKTKSPANPYKINYFEKYQIKSPILLDKLWKLRYTEYPYQTKEKPETGWSQNDEVTWMPTQSQMDMLREFGIERLNDYFYGENAFKLLEAMQNPEWVKTYKEAY